MFPRTRSTQILGLTGLSLSLLLLIALVFSDSPLGSSAPILRRGPSQQGSMQAPSPLDTSPKITPTISPSTASIDSSAPLALPLTGVFGRVLDSRDLSPINHARVALMVHGSSTKVDDFGRFALHLPALTTDRIRVEAAGYRSLEQDVSSRTGTSSMLSIALESTATGRIVGTIDFASKAPETYGIVVDRQVHRFPSEQRRFVIPDVSIGQHRVGLLGQGSAETIPVCELWTEVREGEDSELSFTAPEQGIFEGEVVDELGEPITLAVLHMGHVVVITDHSGRFETEAVLPGEYQASLEHRDFGHLPLGPVTVHPGPSRGRRRFELRRPGDSRLVVRFPNAPEDAVFCGLYAIPTIGDGASKPMRTSGTRTGSLEFKNLTAGRYQVRARSNNRFAVQDLELRSRDEQTLELVLLTSAELQEAKEGE